MKNVLKTALLTVLSVAMIGNSYSPKSVNSAFAQSIKPAKSIEEVVSVNENKKTTSCDKYFSIDETKFKKQLNSGKRNFDCHKIPRVDLSYLNISSKTPLSFRLSKIDDLTIVNSILPGTDFYGTGIDHSNIENSVLDKSNFENAQITKGIIKDSSLKKTNFKKRMIERGVNMKGSDFSLSQSYRGKKCLQGSIGKCIKDENKISPNPKYPSNLPDKEKYFLDVEDVKSFYNNPKKLVLFENDKDCELKTNQIYKEYYHPDYIFNKDIKQFKKGLVGLLIDKQEKIITDCIKASVNKEGKLWFDFKLKDSVKEKPKAPIIQQKEVTENTPEKKYLLAPPENPKISYNSNWEFEIFKNNSDCKTNKNPIIKDPYSHEDIFDETTNEYFSKGVFANIQKEYSKEKITDCTPSYVNSDGKLWFNFDYTSEIKDKKQALKEQQAKNPVFDWEKFLYHLPNKFTNEFYEKHPLNKKHESFNEMYAGYKTKITKEEILESTKKLINYFVEDDLCVGSHKIISCRFEQDTYNPIMGDSLIVQANYNPKKNWSTNLINYKDKQGEIYYFMENNNICRNASEFSVKYGTAETIYPCDKEGSGNYGDDFHISRHTKSLTSTQYLYLMDKITEAYETHTGRK